MTDTRLPDRGVVLWPVGSGDSTTVVVDEEHAVVVPVVDRLVENLPTRYGKPYRAGFALTHGDADHCTGFARPTSLLIAPAGRPAIVTGQVRRAAGRRGC